MLVANVEQANQAVKVNQTKLIDTLHSLLCHYLNGPTIQRRKEDQIILKSLVRSLSALVNLAEARKQMLAPKGGGRDSSEFMIAFVAMARSDMTYLERMERVEVVMNSVKILRVLT